MIVIKDFRRFRVEFVKIYPKSIAKKLSLDKQKKLSS